MPMFDLENYVTVHERITQFWKDYPTGRILTRMEHISESGKQFVVFSAVYKDAKDPEPWATGYAEEHFSDRGPNATSALENCESSSIGRALANAGYATSSESRPSREEMQKVNNYQSSAPAPERVREVAEQVRSASPKVEVASDSRWDTVLRGAQADPENKFLSDLAEKGKKWGNLTDKQMAVGFNAATKILQERPQPPVVATVEKAFGSVEEVGIFVNDESPF